MINIVKNILTRNYILLAIAALLVILLADVKQVLFISKLKTLNRFMPEYVEIIADIDQGKDEFGETIRDVKYYEFYYRKVAEYIPNLAEAYHFWGYCLTHQGRIDEAISAYKQAIEKNGYFFYNRYNLGLLYLKTHQFSLAKNEFAQALKGQPQVNAKIMATSKVYQQIFARKPELGPTIGFGLKRGYSDAAQLYKISMVYEKAQPGSNQNEMDAKLRQLDQLLKTQYKLRLL